MGLPVFTDGTPNHMNSHTWWLWDAMVTMSRAIARQRVNIPIQINAKAEGGGRRATTESTVRIVAVIQAIVHVVAIVAVVVVRMGAVLRGSLTVGRSNNNRLQLAAIVELPVNAVLP